jgi:hypothetical protein
MAGRAVRRTYVRLQHRKRAPRPGRALARPPPSDYQGMPWPVPTVEQLAEFTGRPAVSYTSYANSALLQSAMLFTMLAERTAADYGAMAPDDQQLANMGVMAMGDYIYLRFPYQQVLANPLQGETIGSYSYSKPLQAQARNAAAIEVSAETTGVTMFDLAVRMLAKRRRANGVFSGQVTGFEHTARDDSTKVMVDDAGQLFLLGPADFNQIDLQFFSVSSEMFPADPG